MVYSLITWQTSRGHGHGNSFAPKSSMCSSLYRKHCPRNVMWLRPEVGRQGEAHAAANTLPRVLIHTREIFEPGALPRRHGLHAPAVEGHDLLLLLLQNRCRAGKELYSLASRWLLLTPYPSAWKESTMCCDSRSSPQVSTRATFSSSSKSGVWRAAHARVLLNPRPVTPTSSMMCVAAGCIPAQRALACAREARHTKSQCGNNAACPVLRSCTKSFF